MREQTYHIYLDSHQKTTLLNSLIELKNQLIQQGRYTDCVDELIFKVISDLSEQRYLELDLTKEQREVCDVLLDCRDSQNLKYADFSYIAGLYDALRILVVLFPDRWDMEQVQRALWVNLKTE